MKSRSRAIEARSPSSPVQFAVCGGIVALIWIVFGQTVGYDFVYYDDRLYVSENPLVRAGLTLHGLARAFVDLRTNNWHPLTMMSHMVDCQIFGLNPAGHHFTNVLLHTIATLLLLFWLRSVTARFWPSAFVAALFAIHPLRVESVAWVAERKDVLSAVFFLLTLIAYTRYARVRSFGRYLTLLIAFACGLMAKPMLVTVPVILLLLDYWPLNRLTDLKSFWRLLVEKISLFAFSAVSSVIALQLQVHSPTSVGQLPFLWRLDNALVSYVTYIWQIVWPVGLAVFYPHPDDKLAFWQIALAVMFLIAITWTAFVLRKSRPYLLVGWLWYLIMLLPVIGIIQVGLQAHADRYTYLPHIGLYIALTWLIADLSARLIRARQIIGALGTAALVVLSLCAFQQTTSWRDTKTLWTHAIAVTKNNDVALTNLGALYMKPGEMDKALGYFEQALAIRSSSADRHYSMSLALIHNSLGHALARSNRLGEAIEHLREAVHLRPDYPDGHYNLATALFQQGNIDGAIREWRTMLTIRPNEPGAHTGLANALVQKGLLREAADHYEKALQSDPDAIHALNNLAWLISAGPDDSLRKNEVGLNLALKVNHLTNENNPVYVRTLAAAYAQAGQFDKATEIARRAVELANAKGMRDLTGEIAHDVELYQRREPLRDPTLKNGR